MEPLEIQSWRKGKLLRSGKDQKHSWCLFLVYLAMWHRCNKADLIERLLNSAKIEVSGSSGSVPVLPQLSKCPVMHLYMRPFQKENKSPLFQVFGRKGSTLPSIITILVPPFTGSQIISQVWLIATSKKETCNVIRSVIHLIWHSASVERQVKSWTRQVCLLREWFLQPQNSALECLIHSILYLKLHVYFLTEH